MPLRLSKDFVEYLPLDKLTNEQFLVLAVEAARELNWNTGFISVSGFIASTGSLEGSNEEITVIIEGKHAMVKSESAGDSVVGWRKNQENTDKFISTFFDLKKSLSTDELAQKYEELKPNLVSQEQDILSEKRSTAREEITGILAIFKPDQGYFITPIIINLNVAIFILMTISGVDFMMPDIQSLIKWGANFRPLTLDGEWWRLITSCFLHIGILHLFMNMYALVYIGWLLEPYLGKIRFTAAYLLTGIIAGFSSLWWHEDYAVGAGASGAIFGMYGVFLAMLTTNIIEKSTRKTLLTSIAVFVAYNLLFGLKGNIDNAAHIGGLLGGLLIGYAFIPSLKDKDNSRLKYTTVGLLTVLILVSSFAVYRSIPNDIVTYEKGMEKFSLMESKALEVYTLPPNTPKEELLHGVKDRGIYYWNENIKLIDSFNALNLPVEIWNRNKLLREYCELRKKTYELMYKAVSENTDRYKEEMDRLNKQIKTKMNELGRGRPVK